VARYESCQHVANTNMARKDLPKSAVAEAPVYRSENGSVTLDIFLNPYGSELIGLAESPEGEHVVRTSFRSVERTADGVFGVATEPGTYHTEFNDGKK